MFSLSLGALCPNPAMVFEGTINSPAATDEVVPMKPRRVTFEFSSMFSDLNNFLIEFYADCGYSYSPLSSNFVIKFELSLC
jgi:hypothetical protein